MKRILLNEIISFIKVDIKCIHGDPSEIEVRHLKDVKNVDEFTLDWIGNGRNNIQEIAEKSLARVLLVNKDVCYSQNLISKGKVLIVVDDPKISLIKVINEFFILKSVPSIHPTAIVHKNAELGINIDIGPHVVIGDCIIGDNVHIYGNSFIYDNVIIGNKVEIHNGVSIGNEAHNFVKDENGRLVKFPHIGRVIIEDDVVIGANSVISRGVLEDTIIKKGCKIAQLVFIGANNYIGENCAIRPNVMTSGSVCIGKNSVLASSVTIREHRIIGHDCIIGMGAVVTKDVPAGETWYGNPAKKK